MKKPYKRATPEEYAKRGETIRRLVDQGWSTKEIAAHLDVGADRVRAQIRESDGLQTPRQRHPNPRRLDGKIGKLRTVLNAQTSEFMAWVDRSKPDDLTYSEFVVACAVDAFHEEEDGQYQ